MQGYDQESALRYITGHIQRSQHKAFSPKEMDSLLKQALELDLRFMEESGVLADGMAGDNFYDDDEAFEYISENLIKLYGGNDETAMRLCALVDDYMDLQQAYMENAGLLEWE